MANLDAVVERLRSIPRGLVLVSGAALFAALAGTFPSFSVESELAVVSAWLVVIGVALAGRVERRPAPGRIPPVGWVAWLIPAAAFVALELINSLGFDSAPEHPTWSLLFDPILEWPPARMVAIFCWLLAGWELIRR